MPAVVRVKRHIDEEPLTAFLLNGKKRRVEDGGDVADIGDNNKDLTNSTNEIKTVMKFAGTINKQHDTRQIMRLTKDAAKEMVQQKTNYRALNHTQRSRNEMQHSLREQRFRIVNCMRTTLNDENERASANESNEITIVDIEQEKNSPNKFKRETPVAEINKNNEGIAAAAMQPTDSDTGYVYDLYLPEHTQMVEDVDLMDDYLSFHALTDLVYEDCYKNEEDSDNDSNDSNQENYFTNDYPDEDNMYSFDDEAEEDMLVDALNGFALDNFEKDYIVEEASDDDSYAECSSDDEDDSRVLNDTFLDSISNTDDEYGEDVDNYDPDKYKDNLKKYDVKFHECSDTDEDETQQESDKEDRFHSASEHSADDD